MLLPLIPPLPVDQHLVLQYSAPHLSGGLPHPTLVSAITRHGERSNAYEEGRPSKLPWEYRVAGQARGQLYLAGVDRWP
jgi:hypothetical protein